jgi:hypothetical protein
LEISDGTPFGSDWGSEFMVGFLGGDKTDIVYNV